MDRLLAALGITIGITVGGGMVLWAVYAVWVRWNGWHGSDL